MSKKVGSKLEVWNRVAEKTAGGLKIVDLVKNKRGKIVSKKQSESAKKNFEKRGLKPLTGQQLKELRDKKKGGSLSDKEL